MVNLKPTEIYETTRPKFSAVNFETAEIYETRRPKFSAVNFETPTVEIYDRQYLRNAGPARLAHMQNTRMITPPAAKPSVVWTAAPPKQKLLQHTMPPHPACKRKLTFDDGVE
jgi:hypothetical protein